jgi:hypothetical protein
MNTAAENIRTRHREIAVRYAWLARQAGIFPRGSPRFIWRRRLRELERFYQQRYGACLPYDDAGIDSFSHADVRNQNGASQCLIVLSG